jgi:hypothetical protein
LCLILIALRKISVSMLRFEDCLPTRNALL